MLGIHKGYIVVKKDWSEMFALETYGIKKIFKVLKIDSLKVRSVYRSFFSVANNSKFDLLTIKNEYF